GLGMIATEERLSKNVIGFGLPSAPALYLNMAFSAHRQRIATNIENLFANHPPPQGIFPDNHSPLFDYFEVAMMELVCSYSAIEATANELIPEGFTYQRPSKGNQPPVAMAKLEIERKISLDEKLKRVLPQALGKASPASGTLWPPYSKLQDLRDRLIHLKTVDQTRSGPETETIWGRLLRLGPTVYPNVAANMISHFIKPERRWFRSRPTA
ncbi:hypothetical protein MKK88_01435, partial [Methylobacterium sp. E-005]|uniref:hypothetical protein n=1 Tax=Methylobacterium sp. E-005 TaxID=2836549 RepID=UPI001FB8F728